MTRQSSERPAWSPDGAYVLFSAGQLVVVRRDGSGATTIPVRAPGELALADWTR